MNIIHHFAPTYDKHDVLKYVYIDKGNEGDAKSNSLLSDKWKIKIGIVGMKRRHRSIFALGYLVNLKQVLTILELKEWFWCLNLNIFCVEWLQIITL